MPDTGSRQSQAARLPKNSRSSASGGSAPASCTVRAARTAQASPGSPPNGAESRPRARAHAFTPRASPANAACRSPPTRARTASASVTALSAGAATSPSSARRATACAGSSPPVATATRSTDSAPTRNRSPGTRAPLTSRNRTASGSAAATRSRTRATSAWPGRAATRSRSDSGSAQPMRRDPARCTCASPRAALMRAVTDSAVSSRIEGEGAGAGTGASASRSAVSGFQRISPVPSSTVARTRIGPSPRRESTASSPTGAVTGPPSRAAKAATARCGSRLRPSVRCGV
ncbi:hypothetical protein SAVIM40S_05351 [Streptomyces avidinii]